MAFTVIRDVLSHISKPTYMYIYIYNVVCIYIIEIFTKPLKTHHKNLRRITPTWILLNVLRILRYKIRSLQVGEIDGRHYNDVIMGAIASQITSLTIVYSAVYSGADQRKHKSSASLAFVRGIHRWPVNSPHKGPVRRKMFPFDDVIMICCIMCFISWLQQFSMKNVTNNPKVPGSRPWHFFMHLC